MQKDRMLKLFVVFALTYIFLYLIGVFIPELHDWGFTLDWSKVDYMYYLVPVTGFFFMYFIVDWADEYYNMTHAHSVVFPILFVVLAVIAYYVMLYWYFANFAQLSGMEEVRFEFMPLFLDSAYLYFILSALAGWFSNVMLDRFDAQDVEHSQAVETPAVSEGSNNHSV